MVTGFEFPQQPKTLAMPAEERLRFDEEQSILPVPDATGEEDEPEAAGLRNGRLFDLPGKDNQLLAQHSIFGDEVGSTACQVSGRGEHQRMARRLEEMKKGLFKRRNQSAEELGEQVNKGGQVA